MKASRYQEAIFDFITTGRGSAIVEAVAGGGKTTTIVRCAELIPQTNSCAFVAFNKNIAVELQSRLPKHVKAQTLNAMGFSAWLRSGNSKRNVKVDANKTRSLVDAMLSREQMKPYSAAIFKLIGLAKSVGLVPTTFAAPVILTKDTDAEWVTLMEHHDIELDNGSLDELLCLCRAVLDKSIRIADTHIDFNDQLYMPIIMGVKFWQNDWLFVDEAQDVNLIQRAMLKRALKPGGRLVAVGDPAQAIYGFRGADTEAIDNIKKEFSAVTFPLSVSYRCPQAVVAEAQQHVSHIQASEEAPLGKVETLRTYKSDLFRPTDAILCRNTAPLVDIAYKLIRSKVACRVLGREIGQGLIALVRKMKASDIDTLDERLQSYFERESAKFMAKGQEERAASLDDKITTIRIFIANLPVTEHTVHHLTQSIEALFADSTNGILTLSTIHKSKGGEWERVFILEPQLMPSKYARQVWQQQQEINIQYVAITRAKSELYYIELKGFTGLL